MFSAAVTATLPATVGVIGLLGAAPMTDIGPWGTLAADLWYKPSNVKQHYMDTDKSQVHYAIGFNIGTKNLNGLDKRNNTKVRPQQNKDFN